MKKYIIAISLLLALSLSGCGADAASESVAAATPSLTEMAATSASTLSPSATVPTPSPTVDPLQEKLNIAPEIEGLTKEIQEKNGIEKVVYLYNADNPYGGAEGEYAGEYKKEVTEQDPDTGEVKEVGGVALNPDVVVYKLDKLYEVSETLENGNKGTPNEYALWIPLDISTIPNDSVIRFSYATQSARSDMGVVDFDDDPLAVVCPGKGLTDFELVQISSDLFMFIPNIPEDSLDFYYKPGWRIETYESVVENRTKQVALCGDFIIDGEDTPVSIIENIAFGQAMAQVKSHLEFFFNCSPQPLAVWESSTESFKYGVMEEGGCLVFMRAGD